MILVNTKSYIASRLTPDLRYVWEDPTDPYAQQNDQGTHNYIPNFRSNENLTTLSDENRMIFKILTNTRPVKQVRRGDDNEPGTHYASNYDPNADRKIDM